MIRSIRCACALLTAMLLGACSDGGFSLESVPSKVVDVTYAGETLHLVLPKGYCPVDENSPEGERAYGYARRSMNGDFDVGVLFKDCRHFADVLAHPDMPGGLTGRYLFPHARNEPQTARAQYDRARLLKSLHDRYSENGDGIIPATLDEAQTAISSRLKRQPVVGKNGFESRSLYILAENLQSISYGQAYSFPFSFMRIKEVAVNTETLIQGVPVLLNMDGVYFKEAAITTMLWVSTDTMKDLLDANPETPQ